jgi:hypothetical protein
MKWPVSASAGTNAPPHTPMMSGSARGKTARRPAPSTKERDPSTSSMTVTDMDSPVVLTNRPTLSTSATNTLPSSDDSTVWTLSPSGYVESGCPAITESDWKLINPNRREQLETLAEARGESPNDLIREIVVSLYEDEAPIIEAPLLDAIDFYFDNYLRL